MDAEEHKCNCKNPISCDICDSGLCHNCGGALEEYHILTKKPSKLYWEYYENQER